MNQAVRNTVNLLRSHTASSVMVQIEEPEDENGRPTKEQTAGLGNRGRTVDRSWNENGRTGAPWGNWTSSRLQEDWRRISTAELAGR